MWLEHNQQEKEWVEMRPQGKAKPDLRGLVAGGDECVCVLRFPGSGLASERHGNSDPPAIALHSALRFLLSDGETERK